MSIRNPKYKEYESLLEKYNKLETKLLDANFKICTLKMAIQRLYKFVPREEFDKIMFDDGSIGN